MKLKSVFIVVAIVAALAIPVTAFAVNPANDAVTAVPTKQIATVENDIESSPAKEPTSTEAAPTDNATTTTCPNGAECPNVNNCPNDGVCTGQGIGLGPNNGIGYGVGYGYGSQSFVDENGDGVCDNRNIGNGQHYGNPAAPGNGTGACDGTSIGNPNAPRNGNGLNACEGTGYGHNTEAPRGGYHGRNA